MYGLEAIFALTSRLASLFNPEPGLSVSRATFYNPTLGGGSMLIDAGNGYGEPLNVCLPVSVHVMIAFTFSLVGSRRSSSRVQAHPTC